MDFYESSSLIYSNENTTCNNVILIDKSVSSYQTFYESCNSNTFPILYSSNNSKNDLLTILRNKFIKIDRLALCFTNDLVTNKIFLDNELFFHDNEHENILNDNTLFIIDLIKEFKITNIDYLGCNTLQEDSWKNYYNVLEKETQVIVGASNDRTGNLNYGGNWVMESISEDIETIYFTNSIKNYSYLLDGLNSHTVVIRDDGSLYATGLNSNGQLGLGNNTSVNLLIQVPLQGKIAQSVSCVYNFTMVVMTDGSLYATGLNSDGQLGLGNNTSVNLLTQVPLQGKIAQSVSCGYDFTMVVMTDGTLYATGSNTNGRIGLGNTTSVNSLTQVPLQGKTAQSVSCGYDFTMVVMTDGTLYATGSNTNGRIGLGNTTSVNSLTQVPLQGKTAQSVSCGFNDTMVVMTDGTLYATGSNTNGRIGLGNTTSVNSLTQVPLQGKIAQSVSCGFDHTMVVMTDGTLYGTGFNLSRQLGLIIENGDYTLLLTQVPLQGKTAQSVSCGHSFTMLIMTDGTLYATGTNENGRTGLGDTSSVNEFTLVSSTLKFVETFVELVAPICFLGDSIVETDQGLIEIKHIDNTKHTIGNHKILHITKTVSPSKYIICIEKDSINKNIPNKDTYLTKDHKVLVNGNMYASEELVDKIDGVYKVKYNGETLYNVLLDISSKMVVNNLISETLNPENIIAKFYMCDFSYQEINTMKKENNKCIETRDCDRYIKLYSDLSDKLNLKNNMSLLA